MAYILGTSTDDTLFGTDYDEVWDKLVEAYLKYWGVIK
tara:strand:- start:378 stop:491 length:114 start_codon:yes stop_codon:yes gene_type:complete